MHGKGFALFVAAKDPVALTPFAFTILLYVGSTSFAVAHYLALTSSYGWQKDLCLAVSILDFAILCFIVEPTPLFRALGSSHCRDGLFYRRTTHCSSFLLQSVLDR